MPIDVLPEPIQKLIMDGVKTSKVMKDNHFGVTELLMCPRKAFFRRLFGEEPTLQNAWWFYRGNLLDDAWTRAFPRNQVRVTHRVRRYPIIISGRFDFEDVDGAIADLKTVSDLHYIKRDGYKNDHREQLIFYCYCEGNYRARLYYVSFQDAMRFDLEFTDDEIEEVMNDLEYRALTLWTTLTEFRNKYPVLYCEGEAPIKLDAAFLPPMVEGYDEDYWECRYCTFRGMCYGESKKDEGKSKTEV